jgi:hypothetical protein
MMNSPTPARVRLLLALAVLVAVPSSPASAQEIGGVIHALGPTGEIVLPLEGRAGDTVTVVLLDRGDGYLAMHPLDLELGEPSDLAFAEGVQHRHRLHVLHTILEDDGPFAIVASAALFDPWAEEPATVEIRVARGTEALRLAETVMDLPPRHTSREEADEYLERARDALDAGNYYDVALSGAEAYHLARPAGRESRREGDRLATVRSEAAFLWALGLFLTAEVLAQDNETGDPETAYEALTLLARAERVARGTPEPVREREELIREITRAAAAQRAVLDATRRSASPTASS